MSKNLFLFAVFLSVGLLLSSVSAQVKVRDKDFKPLAGNWSGELEYLDYQDDKSKVKLKLRSTNTVLDGKVSQEIIYTEPNGKEVKGDGNFMLAPDGKQIIEDQTKWVILKNVFDKKSKTRTIIYTAKLQDNNRNADIRETMTIGEKAFSVVKEVRYVNTNEFFVRNTRRFWRL